MRLAPDERRVKAALDNTQTLGHGMDFALVVLVFLGIGYALDRWLGTRPWCMIGLVVFSVVGQFVKMYYDYSAAMEQHEADRVQATQARRATRPATQPMNSQAIDSQVSHSHPVTGA